MRKPTVGGLDGDHRVQAGDSIRHVALVRGAREGLGLAHTQVQAPVRDLRGELGREGQVDFDVGVAGVGGGGGGAAGGEGGGGDAGLDAGFEVVEAREAGAAHGVADGGVFGDGVGDFRGGLDGAVDALVWVQLLAQQGDVVVGGDEGVERVDAVPRVGGGVGRAACEGGRDVAAGEGGLARDSVDAVGCGVGLLVVEPLG